MQDRFSKKKRSEIMSKIRSKNTKLEIQMAKVLRKNKIKYKSQPNLFGKPDFIIENKILLFCDSSFWHGRNWKKLKKKLEDGNNSEYWIHHIHKNRIRDRKVSEELKRTGFTIVRLWDSEILKKPEWCVEEIKKIRSIC